MNAEFPVPHPHFVTLKPDATLSVLRRAPQPEDGKVSRVYYHENVYRAVPGDRGFREIGQTGVECIGEVDRQHVFETVALALRSFEILNGDYRLCLSHLGLVKALFRAAGLPEAYYGRALDFVRAKNRISVRLASICCFRPFFRRRRGLYCKQRRRAELCPAPTFPYFISLLPLPYARSAR